MSLLTLEGIRVSLEGRSVIERADLAIGPGAVVGLLGPNGAGKSSLLRVACGLQRVDAGAVRLEGQDLSTAQSRWKARRMAFMPQEGGAPPRMGLGDLVALGRLPWGETGQTARQHAAVRFALSATGLADLADRPASSLSGGERARMFLARTLAVDARVILVDEPVAALDPAHALSVMRILRDVAAQGRAVVVVLHDLTLAARFCDRLVLMTRGRILADGRPDEVLTDERIAQAYHVRARWLGETPVPWEIIAHSDKDA